MIVYEAHMLACRKVAFNSDGTPQSGICNNVENDYLCREKCKNVAFGRKKSCKKFVSKIKISTFVLRK